MWWVRGNNFLSEESLGVGGHVGEVKGHHKYLDHSSVGVK